MAESSGTPSSEPITMKLLVDSRPPRPRVVFGEAGKDAVDFLFSLLTLPAGTAVRLLGKESMGGSVGNLYASVERLEGSYLRPGFAKDALLCPAVLASPLLRLPAPPAPAPRTFFTCGTSNPFQGCRGYVSDARGTRCPACGNEMATESQYVPPPPPASPQPEQSAMKGYVQGPVTYTVTDDLAVAPMSAISSIARLSAVGGLAALQEKTVQLGYKEGLEILKASMRSKTVLTDVFLGTGKKPPPSSKNGNGGTRYECLTWRV